nr:unnamed protein product [Callosobruchus analis]
MYECPKQQRNEWSTDRMAEAIKMAQKKNLFENKEKQQKRGNKQPHEEPADSDNEDDVQSDIDSEPYIPIGHNAPDSEDAECTFGQRQVSEDARGEMWIKRVIYDEERKFGTSWSTCYEDRSF